MDDRREIQMLPVPDTTEHLRFIDDINRKIAEAFFPQIRPSHRIVTAKPNVAALDLLFEFDEEGVVWALEHVLAEREKKEERNG